MEEGDRGEGGGGGFGVVGEFCERSTAAAAASAARALIKRRSIRRWRLRSSRRSCDEGRFGRGIIVGV